eukprot:607916-Pelagomonas_calceolata.AAC.1
MKFEQTPSTMASMPHATVVTLGLPSALIVVHLILPPMPFATLRDSGCGYMLSELNRLLGPIVLF